MCGWAALHPYPRFLPLLSSGLAQPHYRRCPFQVSSTFEVFSLSVTLCPHISFIFLLIFHLFFDSMETSFHPFSVFSVNFLPDSLLHVKLSQDSLMHNFNIWVASTYKSLFPCSSSGNTIILIQFKFPLFLFLYLSQRPLENKSHKKLDWSHHKAIVFNIWLVYELSS